MSGVICLKCSLSKSLHVLEYEFFKLLKKREKALTYLCTEGKHVSLILKERSFDLSH